MPVCARVGAQLFVAQCVRATVSLRHCVSWCLCGFVAMSVFVLVFVCLSVCLCVFARARARVCVCASFHPGLTPQ